MRAGAKSREQEQEQECEEQEQAAGAERAGSMSEEQAARERAA